MRSRSVRVRLGVVTHGKSDRVLHTREVPEKYRKMDPSPSVREDHSLSRAGTEVRITCHGRVCIVPGSPPTEHERSERKCFSLRSARMRELIPLRTGNTNAHGDKLWTHKCPFHQRKRLRHRLQIVPSLRNVTAGCGFLYRRPLCSCSFSWFVIGHKPPSLKHHRAA